MRASKRRHHLDASYDEISTPENQDSRRPLKSPFAEGLHLVIVSGHVG